ncbi:inhibitor of growth protein 1 [Malaya genurostris]|uniref:inhibitor of growth protein 1 n=1 Tax=Malaya genurostris TaxID=325434 RepID=UPI0026F3AE59|nr:inhibitor of growth protein 1 [Malaya genurostris]
MISQVTVEAHHSATYVENYLDSVENLPDDVQRHLSRIREIDVLYRNHLRDVSVYYDQWSSMNGSLGQLNGGSGGGGGGAGSDSSQPSVTEPSNASRRAMARIQQGLIAAQELGDEKLQVVQLLQDLIDHKTRQLDQDFKNLGSDFFSRLDYNREEKLTEGQQKEIRSNSPGSSCSPNNVNSSPAAFQLSTGNGQCISTVGTNGGNGTLANSGNGSFSTNSGTENGNNGSGSGGNATGSTGNGASGNSNTGTAERGSKRARRTRNEQNSGSANGSSTPNSSSGMHIPMEIDSIDTSHVKQEIGSSSGVGQASGSGATGSGSGKGASGQSSGGGGAGGSGGGQGKKGSAGSGKKKKRKTGRGQAREAREDTPPPEETIDPDEPTYCLCDQISFGEMILCDNDLCPIEWFHFSCVALMSKPKGKWFCPNCRGDRPNVMKPKAQFLKELERYNKEKEEKT